MEETAKQTLNITQNRRKKFCVCLALLFCVGLALPGVTRATSLYFSPSSGSYNVGSNFSVGVLVSSPDQLMNAAGGIVSFPRDRLEITSLSKSGSIITFWAQEPTFSNTAGTVNFEGVVLPDGFKGGAGRIITLNFKAKTAGTASLRFSEGSILAHDGKGTNILRTLGTASYTLAVREIILPEPEEEYVPPPTVPTQAPAAPVVPSLTHPEENKWYSNNSPKFSWQLPADITRISYGIDKHPATNPDFIAEGLPSEVSFENLEDGIWYFHINFRNQRGWGKLTHRKVLIDTVPPLPFLIDIQRDDLTEPSPILFFETIDELSGIEYYKMEIAKEKPFLTDRIKTHSYTLPPQSPGICKIEAYAFDKAGNYSSAQTEIEIWPIETPIITKYPKSVMPDEILTLGGKSLANVTIRVFLQRKGEEYQMKETKADAQGNWLFQSDEALKEGEYEAWVEAKDERGALSLPSEKISFRVGLPPFLQFGKIAISYLILMIALIVLIIGVLAIMFYGWYRISLWRKRVRGETKEVSESVTKAFKALREEVEEQIEFLDGKPGLTKNERNVRDKLKEAMDISEKFIGKEIKDIEKELE